jgi:hypothetical protein
MTTSTTVDQYVGETCARCGQRFPRTEENDDRAPGPFCEPCRSAMWREERPQRPEPTVAGSS